jgi:hypothetical protein
MGGKGGARRKIGVVAVIVLLLVGIAVLGSSGAVGLLLLAIALGIAIRMVARASPPSSAEPRAEGD